MNRCVFLTEMGEGIGFGHVSRCLSIANELTDDFNVEFTIYVHGKQELNFEFPDAINVVVRDWKTNIEEGISEDDIVIVDSYLATEKHYSQLSSITNKSVALDDYYRLKYPSKLLLNCNASADIEKYNYLQSSNVMSGAEYVILNKVFRNENSLPVLNEEVKNVVITVGGSDLRDLLPRFIELLCTKYPLIQFHILSANSEYQATLIKAYKLDNLTVYGFLPPHKMADLFKKCDLAISAAGQSLGELIMSGTPFVPIIVDKDQEPNGQFYLDRQIIPKIIKWDDSNLDTEIHFAFETMLDLKKRQLFMDHTCNIIDGNGVNRICSRLKELI